MKDPNWHTRKRSAQRVRPLGPAASFGFERPRKALREFVEQIPEPPSLEPSRTRYALFHVVETALRDSLWGSSVAGQMAILEASFKNATTLFREFARKLSPARVPEGEEVWKTLLRAFAKDIGLDAGEAFAFIERGASVAEKGERLRALVAAVDLGGKDAAIALVFNDVAENA